MDGTGFILTLALLLLAGGFLAWKAMAQTRAEHNAQTLDLRAQLDAERAARLRAEAQLAAGKALAESQQKALKDSFEAMAGNALRNNNELFLQLARQSFERHSDSARDELERRQSAIAGLVAPLREQLDKHEKMVGELRQSNSHTLGALAQQLEALGQSQGRLEKEAASLANALRSTRARGRWGEIGLRRLAEFSGMAEHCHFEEQVASADGSMRPDMVVSLPGGRQVVVDAKVPLDAYLDFTESTDEKAAGQHLQRHAQAVLGHVRQLSSKHYWEGFEQSVDFVVLYMEVEPAFGAAVSANRQLIAQAVESRVVFATPTTLVALLQTVAFTWKQHQATENAVRIWQSARELHDRLAVFSEHLLKVGGSLNQATKSYNQAVASWESRVQPAFRKMEDLGAKTGKKEIQTPEPNSLLARGGEE